MLDVVRQSDLERFWSKVNAQTTSTGCLVWTGATAKRYGVIRWKADRMTPATRVAWELFYETPPDPALDLLHSCDNRPCVNVLHLREGTPTENNDDAYNRGQMLHGSARSDAKLTEAIVADMRRRYRAGDGTFARLAAEHGVSEVTARDAIRGAGWRRVTEPPVIHP